MNLKRFLCLALVLIAITLALCSCNETTTESSLKFKSVKGGYEVVGTTDPEIEVVIIPETHNGKPVVSIGKRALSGLTDLSNVYIPSSVTTINENAFSDCPNLTSAYIGYSVINGKPFINPNKSQLSKLGALAFGTCPFLQTICYNGTIEDFKSIDTPHLGGNVNSFYWNYGSYEPIQVTCTNGYLTYTYQGGFNYTEHLGNYYYIPVKLKFTGKNGECTIDITLNSDNLPSKQVNVKYGETDSISKYTYDESGNCVKVEQESADFGPTTILITHYENGGQKNVITTPDGNSFTIIETIYDKNGNIVTNSMTDPNSSYVATYTYDDNNNITKSVSKGRDGKESINTYENTYDVNGRLIKVVHTPPADELFSSVSTTYYTYDTNGRLIKEGNDDVYTTYTYDSYGRLTEITNVIPASSQPYIMLPKSYEIIYNDDGNVAKIVTTEFNGDKGTYEFEYKYVKITKDINYSLESELTSLISQIRSISTIPNVIVPDNTPIIDPNLKPAN